MKIKWRKEDNIASLIALAIVGLAVYGTKTDLRVQSEHPKNIKTKISSTTPVKREYNYSAPFWEKEEYIRRNPFAPFWEYEDAIRSQPSQRNRDWIIQQNSPFIPSFVKERYRSKER